MVKKSLIAFVAMVLGSAILYLSFYKFTFDFWYISNTMFVIGIAVFFVSLIIQTGATRVFWGINYTASRWFGREKPEHDSFKSYYDERSKKKTKNVKYLMVISVIYMLIAIIIGLLR